MIDVLQYFCHGSILFKGRPLKPEVRQRSKEELRQVQIVFQMADTALNPSQTIERILARPLQFYKGLKGTALQKRIHELLDLVRLPHSVAQRLPGEQAAVGAGDHGQPNRAAEALGGEYGGARLVDAGHGLYEK